MGKCNRMMQETEPVCGGDRAGELRQPISTRKGKEGTWGDKACLSTASMHLPSSALSASLFVHVTSQISLLPTFSWGEMSKPFHMVYFLAQLKPDDC